MLLKMRVVGKLISLFLWCLLVAACVYALIYQRNLPHFYVGDAVFAVIMIVTLPLMIFLWVMWTRDDIRELKRRKMKGDNQ